MPESKKKSNQKLPWFRLYYRIVDDDKIRLLAFEDRWHFVALCCLKREGVLDEPDESLRLRKMAVKMGLQLRDLEEAIRRISEVGLVHTDGTPAKWNDLQFESDDSKERVRKYREKKKKSECNGHVTAQDTDKETDTDTETDKEPPFPLPGTEVSTGYIEVNEETGEIVEFKTAGGAK